MVVNRHLAVQRFADLDVLLLVVVDGLPIYLVIAKAVATALLHKIKAEGKFSFLHLFVAPFSDIFLRLPVASVVSFQVPFKGGEAGNTRFFGKRMTKKAKNSRFGLLF